jgi:hypothetical protein
MIVGEGARPVTEASPGASIFETQDLTCFIHVETIFWKCVLRITCHDRQSNALR